MTREEYERDRPAGSWIELPDGTMAPNPDDEAMAKRYNLVPGGKTGGKKEGKEVTEDA